MAALANVRQIIAALVPCLAAGLLAVDCGGKASFDGLPSYSGSGGSTASTSGSTSSTSTTNATTSTTTSSTKPKCYSCSEVIEGDVGLDQICPESQAILDALVECVCGTSPNLCATECAETCTGSEDPAGLCQDCITNSCGQQLDACFSD